MTASPPSSISYTNSISHQDILVAPHMLRDRSAGLPYNMNSGVPRPSFTLYYIDQNSRSQTPNAVPSRFYRKLNPSALFTPSMACPRPTRPMTTSQSTSGYPRDDVHRSASETDPLRDSFCLSSRFAHKLGSSSSALFSPRRACPYPSSHPVPTSKSRSGSERGDEAP
ncbi:hypothetical protein CPC08DRAFT_761524 [Agrocybe pediades]|nr:hypothetical protein CPC08DRAFT_761524 [Agrocybe pediades]